ARAPQGRPEGSLQVHLSAWHGRNNAEIALSVVVRRAPTWLIRFIERGWNAGINVGKDFPVSVSAAERHLQRSREQVGQVLHPAPDPALPGLPAALREIGTTRRRSRRL